MLYRNSGPTPIRTLGLLFLLLGICLVAQSSTVLAQAPSVRNALPGHTLFSETPFGWLTNPALVGDTRGPGEFGLANMNDTTHFGKTLALGFRSGGFGLSWESGLQSPSLTSWTMGLGGNASKYLLWGFTYRWYNGDIEPYRTYNRWSFGLALRPTEFLALGWVTDDFNRDKLGDFVTPRTHTASAALRLKPWITLEASATLADSQRAKEIKPLIGVQLEPVRGVFVSGSWRQDGMIQAGLALSFGMGRLGYWADMDKDAKYQGGGLMLSHSAWKERTIFEPHHRWVEYRFSGDCEEECRPSFFGGCTPTLHDILNDLEDLGDDPTVEGVLFIEEDFGASLAQREEIREAILNLRSQGKRTIFYDRFFANGSYYLATACDKIWTAPSGEVGVIGLGSTSLFLRGMLDKIGVTPDLEHIGDYKSASDMFTRTDMSAAQREATQAILDDAWAVWLPALAEGRKISADSMTRMVNRGPYDPTEAKATGLIDSTVYPDDLKKALDKAAEGNQWTSIHYLKMPWRDDEWTPRPKIALVFAEGEINEGKSGGGLMGKSMGGETMAKAIRRAADNPRIEGIVLRVNSPGGSGSASDQIWQAVEYAKNEKHKPVVVSMGGVAGSGGYFIACNADSIFADASTITGSIGVISGKFAFRGLLDKIGVNAVSLRKGENAGMNSMIDGYTPAERERLKKQIDIFYRDFVNKVATGRHKSYDDIHKVAQGRIWSGSRAVGIGLIDRVAGLNKAIACCKKMSGLEDAEVDLVEYPRGSKLEVAMSYGASLFAPKPSNELLEITRLAKALGVDDALFLLDSKDPVLYWMPYSVEIK